jgi:uncharacterized protein
MSGIEIHRDPEGLGPIVTGFSGRGFRVRDAVFPGGLLLTPLAAMAWEPGGVDMLSAASIASLLALDPPPEFILLGTGAGLSQPSRPFVRALEAEGIGVEVMDSRAAARAWGVLRAEERWIGAALMPL